MYTAGALSLVAVSGSWTIKKELGRKNINKRDAVFSLLEGKRLEGYTPAAFFIHFGEGYKTGDAAVNRHLEYFRAIDMDFIKVQYEAEFPRLNRITQPAHWESMPFYKKDFFEKQLYVVKELVKKGKKEAPVLVTLYSPFMSAGHTVGGDMITDHLLKDPEKVKKGMEIIAESTLIFANECIKLGVDGFLASTQGGEGFRFQDPSIFNHYIKPFDLQVMNRIHEACACNVLHICDYVADYNHYSPFLEYPGHFVNCSMKVGNEMYQPLELYQLFKRPIFGGLEKRGPISKDSKNSLIYTVSSVLKNAPEQFILGAECALLGTIDWKMVRMAIDLAHGYSVK
jgi:uroporphyrinogen decarboxylase